MLDKELKRYLNMDIENRLAPLVELLRFSSTADDANSCHQCAQWLAGFIEDQGFETQIMDTPGKPCVFGSRQVDPDLPTLLIYGHYDVQPADPIELWHSDPFEPVIRDGVIYARGADDDKGQIYGHLLAIEALNVVHGNLPVNVKLLFEGEEESGSPHMEEFISKNKQLLSADALVISDGAFFSRSQPSILSGLRGLSTFEIICKGPSHDLHSGLAGGAVANPINALCHIIAAMHDAEGAITLPGFYDDIVSPSDIELQTWEELESHEMADQVASFGVRDLAGGEKAYGLFERIWSRPSLDCNGITGGYQGLGDKTIIPSTATAKMSIRLAPCQDFAKIVASIDEFVRINTPDGVESKVVHGAAGSPVLLNIDTPIAEAGKEAMADGYGKEPIFVRCGASVPITEVFQRIMGLDAVMLGMGLPTDKIHSPNENIPVMQIINGAAMSASFMQRLGEMKDL